MTATIEKSMVRHARESDDLTLLRGNYRHRLNLDQVLVADGGTQLDGMLMLWDGGHGQIRVDHLTIRPNAPESTGAKLIHALEAYCRNKGIVEVVFATQSPDFALATVMRGGGVSAPLFYLFYPVSYPTDEVT